MTYSRSNHLENMAIDYEHDDAYADIEIDQAVLDDIARTKLIFCGDTQTGVLEDCSYVSVDAQYQGQMSPGQQRLYEVLVALQEGSLYTVTTIGKLAQMMGLEHPMSCGKRLENLQSLGAIAGLKVQ
ncbi:hypothetical protein VB780_13905 [Leptolyngbya sp. CCNP1308]|uniref:hypothetical protein n=1 Tax=Leptolyngbya sp. CCNP1308 TaxID=3110255 RepID=UPI002B1FBCDE|nr:hypothetical protein [Leptolyngbya sp. CCNP1308]MEA5449675.1 hypothetical protein [Leptolyngbya sp. CCNP1308]